MYSFRFSPATSIALLLAAAALAPSAILAQGSGRVIGVVRDRETGQPVEGATLLLAGTPRVQLTDNAGRFVFLGMTLGDFVLVVRRVGYEALSVRGRVSGAAPSELTILLHATATPTLGEIEVTARPFQRIDEPATVQTVDRQQLRLAPVTTLTDVIDIQAGVADGHFRGGRTGQAILMIDGLDVRDQFALSELGTTMDLSPTAIEELSVVTGGFGAQYGNALSGVVDVATRSGSPHHWETRASLSGGQLLPDRIGYGQQELHPDHRLEDRDGLAELDTGPIDGHGRRGFECRQGGGRRHRRQAQDDGREHAQEGETRNQSAHANPAFRMTPRPFWVAPSRPVRDSAQPGR